MPGARERFYWWQITISQRVSEFGNRPQRRAQTRQRQDITARGAVPSCDARRDKIVFGALHSRACTRKGRRGPQRVTRRCKPWSQPPVLPLSPNRPKAEDGQPNQPPLLRDHTNPHEHSGRSISACVGLGIVGPAGPSAYQHSVGGDAGMLPASEFGPYPNADQKYHEGVEGVDR